MKTLKCHWCVLIRLFNCHSWTVLGSVWVLYIILSHVIHTFEPLFELIWFKHSKESWWSALSVVPYSTAVAPAAISFEQISLGTICCPIGQQAQIHMGFHSWNLKMAWTRLLHIHCVEIDLEEIIRRFARLHPRRMELANILSEWLRNPGKRTWES